MNSIKILLILSEIGLMLFAFILIKEQIRKKINYKKIRGWADVVVDEYNKHKDELDDKRKNLIIDKGYGVLDDSPWKEELKNFIRIIILDQNLRKFGSQEDAGYLSELAYDVLIEVNKKNGKDIYGFIDRMIEKENDKSFSWEGNRTYIEWIAALFLLVLAIKLSVDSFWVSSLFSLLAGLAVAPPFAKYIEKKFSIWIKKNINLIFSVIFLGVSISSFLNQSEKLKQDEQRSAEIRAAKLRQLQEESNAKTRLLQEAKAAEERKNLETEFQKNKKSIIDELNFLIESKKYDQAYSLVKKFDFINDSDLIDFKKIIEERIEENKVFEEKRRLEALRDENYRIKIADYAIDKYKKESYPKIVEKYRSRLPEIEILRRKAAEMVVDSGKCDLVENVQISGESSLKSLRFFIDCKNGSRVYLTEKDIKNEAVVITQAEKAWNERDAIEECRRLVLTKSAIPSTVDFHKYFGTNARTNPSSGNVVVDQEYDAKNIYGVDIGYSARCTFLPDNKKGKIEIFLRGN